MSEFITTKTEHVDCEKCETQVALASLTARLSGAVGATAGSDVAGVEHSATVRRVYVDTTLDEYNGIEIAEKIEQLLEGGVRIAINGEPVETYWTKRLGTYSTGSFSFHTPARTRPRAGRTNTIYVKRGARVVVTAL